MQANFPTKNTTLRELHWSKMGCIDDKQIFATDSWQTGLSCIQFMYRVIAKKKLPRNSDVKCIGSFRPVLRIAFKG